MTSSSRLHVENSNQSEGSNGDANENDSTLVEMKTPEPLYEDSCLDEEKEAELSSDQHRDSIDSTSKYSQSLHNLFFQTYIYIYRERERERERERMTFTRIIIKKDLCVHARVFRVRIRRVSGPDDCKEGDSLLLDHQGVIMAVSLSESQVDDDKEMDSSTSKPEQLQSDAAAENKNEDADDLGIPLLVTVNGQVTAICYFKLADDTLDQSDRYPILSDSANKDRNRNHEENLRRKALHLQQRSSAHSSPSGQSAQKREEEDPISLNVDNIVEEKNVNMESKEEIVTSTDENVSESRGFEVSLLETVFCSIFLGRID